jgi:hypothetical protein
MVEWVDWPGLEQWPADYPSLRGRPLAQAQSEAAEPVDLQAQDWLLPRRRALGERPVSEGPVFPA